MESEHDNFIFQQDCAPPNWMRKVRAYFNENLPERWIEVGGDEDSFLMKLLPQSPDMSLCDFFLRGYVKIPVYVPLFKQ